MTNKEQSAEDRDHLRRCLRLAARARGATSPNPMVGALVVRDGEVVAEAYHRRAGAAHAEQMALATAGPEARGATLYTNMEPCCHHGRTPPCVEAIIAAGVRRVVACTADPDCRVDHRGFEALRGAGIAVDVGLLADEAARLNEAYLKFKGDGVPFVVAKAALSADGRMATRSGQSQWISGETARRRTHRLRVAADAVLVGVGTLLSDNPRLTARDVRGPGPRFRGVLDSHLRTPTDSLLIQERDGEALIFTTEAAPDARRAELEAAGARVRVVEATADGRVAWRAVLRELAGLEVLSVLLEGGSELLTSALEADIIDKLFLVYAPLLIGGSASLPLWGGKGSDRLEAAPRLRHVTHSRLGDDWAVEAYIHPPKPIL